MLKITELIDNNHLLIKVSSGSIAQGLNNKNSDIDIKGVFITPKQKYYSLKIEDQINDKKNDIVFYELDKFFYLLSKSNPNALELLFTKEPHILYKHALWNKIHPQVFLSKQCQHTFGHYAISQLKRAKGLNKKMNYPSDFSKKEISHFCYILKDSQPGISFDNWIDKNQLNLKQLYLSKLDHCSDQYRIFFSDKIIDQNYLGFFPKAESSQLLCFSPLPADFQCIGYLYFNKDGYQKHLKEFNSYQQWKENRNEERLKTNFSHGKNYDSKNAMHLLRLLDQALTIATEKNLTTTAKNKNFLLDVKKGKYSFESIQELAQEKLSQIDKDFSSSDLPEAPNIAHINQLLFEIRDEYYQTNQV